MSDFFGKLKSGAGKVAFEADKMNRVNRAKGEMEKIKGQIQAQYCKLGELYYTQRANSGVSGPAYDEICQVIAGLEPQVAAKNEEIQRINAEAFSGQAAQPQAPSQFATVPQYPPAPPAPAADTSQYVPPAAPVAAAATTKFCTNCGREMALEVKFCPDCGTKM